MRNLHLITGFIGLAFEGISSFLHKKGIKPYIEQSSMCQFEQTDMLRNKLMHLENTLVMYEIYNVETLEKLCRGLTSATWQ